MSSPLDPTSPLTLAVAHDRDGGCYRVSLTSPDLADPVLALRMPAVMVDAAVLDGAVQIELRANGLVVAYRDGEGTSDLATRTMRDLIAEAVQLATVDDCFELAELEDALSAGLSAVRAARAQLG